VEVVIGILSQARVVEGDSHMREESKEPMTRAEELSNEEFGSFISEPLYEYSLKIFGDVFESIIGAVFLDCKSISKTEAIL
jgi:dsRNA-specific ribonuclease